MSTPSSPENLNGSPSSPENSNGSPSSPENANGPSATKTPKKIDLETPPTRYHGKGCSMEIAILEKHDENCPYKKEGDAVRSVDDRSGSYEVISRLTCRTCKENDGQDDDDMMPEDAKISPSTDTNVSEPSEETTKTPS